MRMNTSRTAQTTGSPSEAPTPQASDRVRPRPNDPSRRRGQDLVIGRLQDFGRAPYQFRSGESESYFVKLLTRRGEKMLWGKDLERALSNSATQPERGDQVGARRSGRDAVTIVAKERDAEGRVVRQSEQLAHRQRWVVEKVQFFAERSRLAQRVRDEQADLRETVRTHPELASTFISLQGAKDLAERRIADPRDRERFLNLVREAMARSIHRGEPLPSVRLNTPARSANRTSQSSEAQRSKGRDAPTR